MNADQIAQELQSLIGRISNDDTETIAFLKGSVHEFKVYLFNQLDTANERLENSDQQQSLIIEGEIRMLKRVIDEYHHYFG